MPPNEPRGGGDESGNVFVFVILGVVLFAALMFVASRGMNESPGALGSKKTGLSASDILAYAQKMDRVVARLQSRFVSENALSFENPVVAGYANPACVDAACRVFDPAGGAISYLKPDPDWFETAVGPNRDWVFANMDEYQDVGTTCGADSCTDLAMILYPLKKDLCMAINDRLGVDNPSDAPPTDNDVAGGLFTGGFSYAQTVGDEPGGSAMRGRHAACFTQDTNGAHFFYQILIER